MLHKQLIEICVKIFNISNVYIFLCIYIYICKI